MAGDVKRQFKITELRQTGANAYVEGGVKFVWDRDTQSSPFNSWEYAISLRTVKQHYPGVSANPTEQVLGWNYEDFDLEGKWDDRYAGAGFAEQTRIAMEGLIKRANRVRLEFEGLTITGLITKLTFTYRTKYLQKYVLHFSPHRRDTDEITSIAPPAVANPSTYETQAEAILARMQDIHAGAPHAIMAGTMYADVAAQLNNIASTVELVSSIVSNRVILVGPQPGTQPINSLARLAQAFTSLRNQSVAVLPLLASAPPSTTLFFSSAVGDLSLETWARGMCYQARAMVVLAWQAQQDLSARISPDALALYRPRAGESLYAISNRFYGTPGRWRDIYDRNRMSTFTLAGTESLVIPGLQVSR
jgi:hypothetical protein